MTPSALDEAMCAALPHKAQQALLLARQQDPRCDPAGAFIIANDRPAATTDALASALRAQTRRDRRAGGAHGPARYAGPLELEQGEDQDPAELVAAVQELAKRRIDIEQALQLEPAHDARALARQEHITLRRAQQILARRRVMEEVQGVLL